MPLLHTCRDALGCHPSYYLYKAALFRQADVDLVTDSQMSLPAETALECAPSFYKYGAALFWKAQDESDILGNQVQAAAARKDAAALKHAAQQDVREEDSEEDEDEEEEDTDGELGERARCGLLRQASHAWESRHWC